MEDSEIRSCLKLNYNKAILIGTLNLNSKEINFDNYLLQKIINFCKSTLAFIQFNVRMPKKVLISNLKDLIKWKLRYSKVNIFGKQKMGRKVYG